MTPKTNRLNVHSRATFVRSSVKKNATTTRIIEAVMPYFPKQCHCIAGFLDDSDQYWKVNYHWDLLVHMIDKFLAMPAVSSNLLTCARAIRGVLLTNSPNPQRGYRTDRTVGATKDQSQPALIVRRHATLKQSKRDFEAVLLKAGVIKAATKSNPVSTDKPWWLAVAPVAAPSTSTHGTGYALDIEGNNAETSRIAKALGATLVFNEASHVHVEWKNGARIQG